MKRCKCPACAAGIYLLHLPETRCAFCGALLKRVVDSYELAGIPSIETTAEIAKRQQAVRALQGA